MEQTVYIDLFFLINFSMDFLCFFLTSRLLSIKMRPLRCVIAAALGGVYACAALFISLEGVASLLIDFLACALMSVVAYFRRGEGKSIFSYTVVYTAVSIVLGGFMTVLFSLFNRLGFDRLLSGGSDTNEGISVWLFALLAALSAFAALMGGRFFKRRSMQREGRLYIHYASKQIELKALCDSGNLLREPISGKACVIADGDSLKSFLPQALLRAMRDGYTDALSTEQKRRVRVVPASTVNGSGMLWALRVDRLELDMGKGKREIDAYLAVAPIGISAEGAEALIPIDLLASA